MNTGVMIAYLPTTTDWCRQDLPHMTLVYCGDIPDLKPTALNDLAKDALSAGRITGTFTLDVVGVDVFGDEERVDVLRLHATSQLHVARRLVETWNGSEYSEFKPHATIGPEGSAAGIEIPMRLHFNRIMVAWGDQHLVFPLDW